MEDRKRIVANHYEPLLNKYSRGYEILDWDSLIGQIKRFEVLSDNIELTGKKLLDVGCGTGDLYGFFIRLGLTADYYGIDILPKMVDRAHEIHPEGRFFTGDIFRESPFSKKQFDIVFCSGVFNLNMGDNEIFLKKALPVFFNHAKSMVVFNLLEGGDYAGNNKYFFFNQKDVLHWIREYSDNVKAVTGYVSNDFTIIAEVREGDR